MRYFLLLLLLLLLCLLLFLILLILFLLRIRIMFLNIPGLSPSSCSRSIVWLVKHSDASLFELDRKIEQRIANRAKARAEGDYERIATEQNRLGEAILVRNWQKMANFVRKCAKKSKNLQKITKKCKNLQKLTKNQQNRAKIQRKAEQIFTENGFVEKLCAGCFSKVFSLMGSSVSRASLSSLLFRGHCEKYGFT